MIFGSNENSPSFFSPSAAAIFEHPRVEFFAPLPEPESAHSENHQVDSDLPPIFNAVPEVEDEAEIDLELSALVADFDLDFNEAEEDLAPLSPASPAGKLRSSSVVSLSDKSIERTP